MITEMNEKFLTAVYTAAICTACYSEDSDVKNYALGLVAGMELVFKALKINNRQFMKNFNVQEVLMGTHIVYDSQLEFMGMIAEKVEGLPEVVKRDSKKILEWAALEAKKKKS